MIENKFRGNNYEKSLISVVLIFAMILSMSVNVFATDWESEIDVVGAAVVNNVYYNTLQEAIDNANGNVVTLLLTLLKRLPLPVRCTWI